MSGFQCFLTDVAASMSNPSSTHRRWVSTRSGRSKVDKSRGMDSYDYMLTYEAITVDSRMMWRGEEGGGVFFETFDNFSHGGGAYYRGGNSPTHPQGGGTHTR